MLKSMWMKQDELFTGIHFHNQTAWKAMKSHLSLMK